MLLFASQWLVSIWTQLYLSPSRPEPLFPPALPPSTFKMVSCSHLGPSTWCLPSLGDIWEHCAGKEPAGGWHHGQGKGRDDWGTVTATRACGLLDQMASVHFPWWPLVIYPNHTPTSDPRCWVEPPPGHEKASRKLYGVCTPTRGSQRQGPSFFQLSLLPIPLLSSFADWHRWLR